MRESPTGFLTGKGAFSTVSLIERAALCVKIYDELKAESIPLDETKTEKLKAAEAFLMKYRIPTNPEDRKPLSDYIKPSTIEAISESSALPDASPLPLFAGVSTTAGRTLRALYDIAAFTKEGDETFDFQEARIAANLCAGLLGQDHHHSFIELVEPYNRLLSVVGIRALEKPEDEDTARMAQSSQFPVVRINEHMMPLFFDPSYKDSLVERAEGLKAKVEKSRGSTPH